MERIKQNFKTERPKKPFEALTEMNMGVAKEINLEAGSRFNAPSLLSPDGSIRTGNFARSSGGIYDDEKIAHDEQEVQNIEFGFTGASDANVAEFYRKEKGCHTPAEIIAHYKKEKEKSKSAMFEKAMQVLLHKFLKDEFLVVRTAPIDDYKAGVDNLIINKETGDVICAFDEVHDSKGGEYTAKKIEKVRKIAEKGGASIRYGLTVQDGRITQTEIKNVPVFAISMLQSQFEKLLPALLESGMEHKADIEKETVRSLVASLAEQVNILRSSRIKDEVRSSLVKVEHSLGKIKKLVD